MEQAGHQSSPADLGVVAAVLVGGVAGGAAFRKGDRSPSLPGPRAGVLPPGSDATVTLTVTTRSALAAAAACSDLTAETPVSSALSASGISPCTVFSHSIRLAAR